MQFLSWFQSHIGQTIYRDPSCQCNDCQRIETEGLEILDDNHAIYLFDIQNAFAGEEGEDSLNYRETL